MDRGHFDDGAYYVDVSNKFSREGFLKTLATKLNLLSSDENDIIEMLNKQNIVILIDNCSKIIERDLENLINTLRNITTAVYSIKVIVVTY